MPRRLIISPHLDDAVLSAWHGLAGADATVVTVFAGIPDAGRPLSEWDRLTNATDPAAQMQLRRQEDVTALQSAGVRQIHLDLLDEQYRTGRSPYRRIVNALEEIVHAYDEVWFPAAIGKHLDHVLTTRAALELRGDFRRVMYADLPYWAVQLDADGALGFPTLTDVHEFAPLAPLAVPVEHRLDEHACEAKWRALSCYVSQFSQLQATFPSVFDANSLSREWTWELPVARAEAPTYMLLRTASSPQSHDEERPFATVLMRTRGDRPEPLRQALRSIADQQCQDLELLILAHNVPALDRAAIQTQVDQLPEWLRAATSLIPIDGGSRSRPLNTGIDTARGEYIAILDDDDLALPDWISEFHRLSKLRPGLVLRAGVVEFSMASSTVTHEFPDDYDFIEHLRGNESPLCGLAFPVDALRALDLRFDESLPVVEDWDFLLRAASYIGVACSTKVTSHYRKWSDAANSAVDHASEAWRTAESRVRAKTDAEPLVLPPGSARQLREERELLYQLQNDLHQAWNLQRTLEQEKLHLAQELERRTHELIEVRGQLDALTTSTSWRVTAPLRRAKRLRQSDS